ncbi:MULTISPECIES: hypothetical protein [unclassified Streptomyces]|uniref:hypothetical protein n=1 Tax=unclassified Streptomyces TaxID=2593676 RepID=UPI0035D99B57
MINNTDFIGGIHPWLTRYDAMAARHAESLAPFENEDGEPQQRHEDRYDERRIGNAIEADTFLYGLVQHLTELAGPPVPGAPFTLTWAGPERHDGKKPYSFVVCASDLDDARRTLVTLPFWRQWYEEQRGWRDPDDQAPDVLFVADESHPGIPGWGAYNDLRREQAAALAETAEAPALPPGRPALTSAAPALTS